MIGNGSRLLDLIANRISESKSSFSRPWWGRFPYLPIRCWEQLLLVVWMQLSLCQLRRNTPRLFTVDGFLLNSGRKGFSYSWDFTIFSNKEFRLVESNLPSKLKSLKLYLEVFLNVCREYIFQNFQMNFFFIIVIFSWWLKLFQHFSLYIKLIHEKLVQSYINLQM